MRLAPAANCTGHTLLKFLARVLFRACDSGARKKVDVGCPRSGDATLRVVASLRDIARADWDACANPATAGRPGNGNAGKPLAGIRNQAVKTAPPRSARTSRSNTTPSSPTISSRRWRSRARRRGRPAGSASISSSTDPTGAPPPSCPPISSRIRWANTSSTTAGRRPTSGPAAATTPSSRSRCPSPRSPGAGFWSGPAPTPTATGCSWREGITTLARRHGVSSVHATFLPRGGMGLPRRGRVPPAHRPAVPFPQPRLPRLRGLPRRPRLAEAEGDPPRAARRGRARHRHRPPHRPRPDRGGVGRLLRLLHGHRLAEVGPALPQPHLLLAPRRADERPGAPDARQARRPAGRRRPQPDRQPTRSTAATGARSRSTPSSISSSATTRRSNGASPTA